VWRAEVPSRFREVVDVDLNVDFDGDGVVE
jgi:hypothetical protein